MNFLSPLFLAGAVTAAVPLLLHLLKREPEPRVKFAAVKFLKRAPVELTEKRHFRELLLLALRIAALVLLALAFARPFLGSGVAMGPAGVTMIAIDTSYSLSGPGRIDRARQLAKDAVKRAPTGDAVGVLTFDDVAEVIARPSTDRAFATSAIDSVAAGSGATRYRVGLDTAARALGDRRGTIVVVTDLQEGGWDVGDRASVPESAHIEIADVGALPPNLAVTAILPAAGRIGASVRNTDSQARTTRVRLMLDGHAAGETTASIGPNASTDVVFVVPGHLATAAVAEVAIDDPDGLQADNVRFAVLEETSRPSVLIVTATGDLDREAFYVKQALAAGAAGGAAYQITASSSAQLSSWGEARMASQSAVLLLSTRGLERRGREALAAYVRAGGGVLVAAGPEIDTDVVAGVLGDGSPLRIVPPAAATSEPRAGTAAAQATTTLAPADVRHPIFQPLGNNAAALGLVKFHAVARIGGAGCQTLARFTSGEAAVLDCSAGDGRGLVIASDLDRRWNDFPVHPSFVAFLHESVRYLASGRRHGSDYLVGDVPSGVPRKPGIATVTDEAVAGTTGRVRQVAVNVDPREGDPARISTDEFESAVTRLKAVGISEAHLEARQQEDRQHLWRYVLVLMIAALAIESVVASRTT
jgi:hypothetical protein